MKHFLPQKWIILDGKWKGFTVDGHLNRTVRRLGLKTSRTFSIDWYEAALQRVKRPYSQCIINGIINFKNNLVCVYSFGYLFLF